MAKKKSLSLELDPATNPPSRLVYNTPKLGIYATHGIQQTGIDEVSIVLTLLHNGSRHEVTIDRRSGKGIPAKRFPKGLHVRIVAHLTDKNDFVYTNID